MRPSVMSLTKQIAWASSLIVVSGAWLFAQTSTPCPDYSQIPGVQGMANNAKITVQMVDNAVGQWDTDGSGSQQQTVSQTLSNFTNIAGSNQSVTSVENTDTEDLSGATTATPVMVMSMATQPTLDSSCSTAEVPHPTSCTTDATINGTIVYTRTQMLPSYAAAYLAPLSAHELGGHGDYGWDDCNGPNCTGSVMNPTLQPSVTAPTPNCDIPQAKRCGR